MDIDKVLNKVNDYNYNYYDESGYIKFDDYISNKYDNVHESLYKDALFQFKKTNNLTDNDYSFTEIKPSEYNKPSSVMVTQKKYPFLSKRYSLSKYWNLTNYNILKGKKLSDIKINGNTINDWVITYIDYARGKVIVYSKMYDIEREANFDEVNYGRFMELKENTLANTFGALRKKY